MGRAMAWALQLFLVGRGLRLLGTRWCSWLILTRWCSWLVSMLRWSPRLGSALKQAIDCALLLDKVTGRITGCKNYILQLGELETVLFR